MSPGQAALSGTYALVSVNGKALPADITSDGSRRVLLLSETLRLDGRGNATDDLTERDSLSNSPAQVVFDSRSLAYTIDGSTVHFRVLCGPGASCVYFPDGTIVGSDTLVIPGFAQGAQPYIYRKMP